MIKYATHPQKSVLGNTVFGVRISTALSTSLRKVSAGYLRVEVINLYHTACVGPPKKMFSKQGSQL